jgi:hypothetical protein
MIEHGIVIAADPDFLDWAAAQAVTDPLPPVPQSRATEPPVVASQACDAAMQAPENFTPPMDWQVRAVYAAVQTAREWGLRFPRFTVVFVDSSHEQILGLTTLEWDGHDLGLVVRLHCRLHPERIMRTLLHELQHVPDLARGRRDPRDVAEARADTFAARVLGPAPADVPDLMPRWWS